MAHRPNILKLATKISLESLTYTGITYEDPEYKILEPIVDDDMCEIIKYSPCQGQSNFTPLKTGAVFGNLRLPAIGG